MLVPVTAEQRPVVGTVLKEAFGLLNASIFYQEKKKSRANISSISGEHAFSQ
jgi:hypothetical protein